jgi:hypothetical protein
MTPALAAARRERIFFFLKIPIDIFRKLTVEGRFLPRSFSLELDFFRRFPYIHPT